MEKLIRTITESDKPYYTKQEIIKIIKDEMPPPNSVLTSGDVTVNLEEYCVYVNGKKHQLPRKVTLLLHYLMLNEGKVMRRRQILDNVWDMEFITDRTIDVHISKIREVVGTKRIKTTIGVGYEFKSY